MTTINNLTFDYDKSQQEENLKRKNFSLQKQRKLNKMHLYDVMTRPLV